MLGDFSCKVAFQILGLLYPAYLSFKDVQKNDAAKIRLWLLYWCAPLTIKLLRPLNHCS